LPILLWGLFGLVVGVVAKLMTPGRDARAFVVNTLLCIAGAVGAGLLGGAVGLYPSGESTVGVFVSILGACFALGIRSLWRRWPRRDGEAS
jgi:uncharacterized membrane protein YeaQ/YmgE (transglycosylase-associated protein family)